MNSPLEDKVSIKFPLDDDNILHLTVNKTDEQTINNVLKTLKEMNYIGDFNILYDPEKLNNDYYDEFYQKLGSEERNQINSYINGTKFNKKMKLVWMVLVSPITGYKVNGIIEEAIQHFYGVHTKSKIDQKWFLDAITMISGLYDANKSTIQAKSERNIAHQYIKLVNEFHLDKVLKNVENKSVATHYFYEAQKHIVRFLRATLNDGKINDMQLTMKLYQSFNDYVLQYENEILLTKKENLQAKQANLKQHLGLN
jgi:hypothetical protein